MTPVEFREFLLIATELRVAQFKVGDVEVIFAPIPFVAPSPTDADAEEAIAEMGECGKHPSYEYSGGMCMKCGPEQLKPKRRRGKKEL